MQLRWRRRPGIAAWPGFEQRRGAPRRLYFSCIAKKSTQKKARKGGHPLFQPPRLSRVRTIQPRRPKPAYSGTPAPATAPRSDVAVWLGPQNAPSRYCWGRPHVGADALIGPFLRPARRRFPREIHPIRGPRARGHSAECPCLRRRAFRAGTSSPRILPSALRGDSVPQPCGLPPSTVNVPVLTLPGFAPWGIHPIRGPAGSSSQTPVRSVRLFGEHPLPFVARPPPTETAVSVGKGAAAK